MTSFTVQIQVGDVVRVLTVVEAALNDPSDLMTDVLLVMIRSTQLTFQAQGRPQQWDDLAPSTERRRLGRVLRDRRSRRLGTLAALGSIQILRDAGLLLQSVGGNASGAFNDAQGFGESARLTATIGTNHPGWHNQFADTRGWRPARPFLLHQDQDEEDIADMAVQWMLRTGPYAVA